MEHPCTGETVIVSGETKLLLYPRTDGNGGTHFLMREVTKGKGETVALVLGARTVSYQLNSESVNEFYVPPPDPDGTPRESTTIFNFLFLRQGEDPNAQVLTATDDDYKTKSTVHITFNANGVPTAQVFHNVDKACAKSATTTQ